MKVSVFGLGYVGAVTAACMTRAGHEVVGVDVQPAKLQALQQGRSPIVEPGLDALLAQAHQQGRLQATDDAAAALAHSEACIICVGTPSLASGGLNLDFVRKVCTQIAEVLSATGKSQILVLRSTMLPGSTRSLAAECFASLQQRGQVELLFAPEFLREGSAVADFEQPSLAAMGTADGTAPRNSAVLALFGGQPSLLTWEGAELLKYACNSWHAMKVAFANEVGRLGKHLQLDSRKVMEVLCQDSRLNISSHYLRPGAPFGGSCLPKDLSALIAMGRREGLALPLLEATTQSNQAHAQTLLRLVLRSGCRRVGILGLSFKAGTDDLRGSPMVELAEQLLAAGHELRIHDPQLHLAQLHGANAAEMQRRLPRLAGLLCSNAQQVLDHSELLVISQRCVEYAQLQTWAQPQRHVLDVMGWSQLQELNCHQEGICW